MVKILFVLTPLLLTVLFCQAQTKPAAFNKVYQGTIGEKYAVKFWLEANSENLIGGYFYESQGFDIAVSGKINEQGAIYLNEFNADKKITATLTAIISGDSIAGVWKSIDKKNSYKLSLKEDTCKILPLPKNIEGKYVIDYNETSEFCKCKLEITVFRKMGRYYYTLKTNKRNKTGLVKISRGDCYCGDCNFNYITFNGMMGDENAGDLQGFLGDGSISIQNTGNEMNYYVRLSECDVKYIYLKKVQ